MRIRLTFIIINETYQKKKKKTNKLSTNRCYSNYLIRLVADHSLIAKTDGKTQIAAVKPAAAATTTTTPAVVKVKAIKKDEVDRRKTMQRMEVQLQHATKGFDAVFVLFQYLVGEVSSKKKSFS